jgi:DNA adenine methylase
VQLECDDALKVIERFDTPETLFYVDPPYVEDQRCKRWKNEAYRFDYTEEDHRDLARVLRSVEGMIVLSGFESALYDELYAGWHCVKKTVALSSSNNGRNSKKRKPLRVECLWISPGAVTQKRML